MRILLEGAVPARPADWVLREAQPGRLVALVVYLGIFGGACWVAYVAWREGVTAFAIGAGLLALLFFWVSRLQLKVWRASRLPSNWQLRASTDGLYVKYRSYMNHEMPTEAPAVLFLANREIAWLAEHRVRALLPNAKGSDTMQHTDRTLAIGLRDVDTTAIAQALAEERRQWVATGKHSRRRFGDYPLRPQNEELHLRLRNPKRALQGLKSRYQVRAAIEVDRGRIGKAPREAQESMLLELAEAGRSIDAATLAQEIYGHDMKTAKDFVEQLAGRR